MVACMGPSLTLHIGTPKSGTTYLQTILSASRRHLSRAGILYPGERYLPHSGLNQQPAVYAVGQRFIRWVGAEARENGVRYFHRLCEEVSAHTGRVLISAEALAFFDADEIRQLLAGLHADSRQVDVVITARDLGRVLPSLWQQNIKNGSTEPLDGYLASVAALRDAADVPLWTAFGLPGLVRRWQDVVGSECVTLVTAPHDGGDALWHRFVEATGLPWSMGSGADRPAGLAIRLVDRNLSLTSGQAELLRRVNLELRARSGDDREARILRGRLLQSWMSAGDGHGSRIAVPTALLPAVHRWADEDRGALQQNGVRVVGDLADLLPRTGPGVARAETEAAHAVQDSLDEAARAVVLLAAAPVAPGSSPGRSSAAGRPLRRYLTALVGGRAGRRPTVQADSPAPAVVDLSGSAAPAAEGAEISLP